MLAMIFRPTFTLRLTKRTAVRGGHRANAKRSSSASASASAAVSTAATSVSGHSYRYAEGEKRKANESHIVSSTTKARQQALQSQDAKFAAKLVMRDSAPALPIAKSPAFVPDYREKVLLIFQRLAEINQALGEKYKAQSYQVALDKLKRDDYIFLHLPPNILSTGVDDKKRQELISTVNATPAVGDKLKAKIVEILSTGDLAELHSLQAKPIIRAIQELTQVHGFGPRTAVTFYKTYGIKSVAELQQRVKEQETGESASSSQSKKKGREGASIVHLTEAQRLGLKYHRDIMHRISHDEGRLHEAFLKLRLRKYLGKGYELYICGSYRRRLPTSGDIDVLITRKTSNASSASSRKKKGDKGRPDADGKMLAPQEVLAAFVDALKQERYVEATLAQGQTKFMGVSRLKSYNYHAGGLGPKLYPARRLDIRFVEPECFPAALLYFTGSKNFNVIMRAEAIKQNYVLNEYGLFRNDSGRGGAWNADAFQKLVRAQYYSARSPAFTAAPGQTQQQKQKQKQMQELHALWEEVEARRVKVRQERDIFAALGMPYVQPEKREM